MTIDGDNPNTGGTNRNLTVSNTAVATVIGNSVIRIATAATVTSADNNTIKNCILLGNVTSGNLSGVSSATGSSGISFGVYVGGNGGATAADAPTAITSATTNTAVSGTTVNNLLVDNNSVSQCARAIAFATVQQQPFQQASLSPTTRLAVQERWALILSRHQQQQFIRRGIFVAGTTAVTITGNTLQNILSYVTTPMAGIELASAMGTGTTNVSTNTITAVTNNGTASGAQAGILSPMSADHLRFQATPFLPFRLILRLQLPRESKSTLPVG